MTDALPELQPAALTVTLWVPECFIDEITPTPRETPDHWLIRREDGWVVGDQDETVDISIGETMLFSGVQLFGRVELTIRRDGGFEIAGAVEDCATHFCEPDDSDTLAFSIEEFAANSIANMVEDENTIEVETYRWDDKRFRLVESIEGVTFVPVDADAGDGS